MNRTNILLLASNPQYCQEAQQFFAKSQYKLTVAVDRQTAFSSLKKVDIALILCQLSALYLDESGFLQQLQSDRRTAKIPTIFLGNRFDGRQHRQVMAMGADDILFVPYDFTDIEAVMVARLSKNQALLKESQIELEQLRYSVTTFLPHEMRTALTGIIAASELLSKKHETLDPLIVKEMLSCINVSGKKLSRLAYNFLLYSELKSLINDELKIAKLRQNFTSEVKSAIANTVQQYGEKYDRQEDTILNIENTCIQMGLTNFTKLVAELIDNACKFSPHRSPITITSKVESDRFILEIANQGRGIAAEQIAKIGLGIQFERSTYEQEGFGLGLAIVRDLVELHGGNIAIESELDRLTSVRISLPLAVSKLEAVSLSGSLQKSNRDG